MRKYLLAAGFAVATLIPSTVLAQQTCEQRATNRTVGTIAGAGLGALVGGAVAGHDDRTAGALIGAVGGAVAGNQLTKGHGDCSRAYGYYDNAGMWHASSVQSGQAAGYYDRDGGWVNGAPNGYYDHGRWVEGRAEASRAAYRDSNGRYVPAAATGYYDSDGRWVAGAASGHYDRDARWVAGPAVGRYDVDGRWIAGEAAGRRDANGAWVADAQPGYYDNGRWVRGEARGYYDGAGRWQAAADARDDRNVRDDRGVRDDRADYARGGDRAPTNSTDRRQWMQARIERGMSSGALSRQDGDDALRQLNLLRRDARHLRGRDGSLSPRQERRMMARLDDIRDGLHWSHGGRDRQD